MKPLDFNQPEPLEEYASPKAGLDPAAKPLGSLAQSARGKELNQARWILVFVGLLTLGGNIFLIYNTPREVDQVLTQANIDPAQMEQTRQAVTMFCYVIYGGLCSLGVLFLLFSVFIKSYPVPITIISLVLYILANVGVGLMNPAAVASGLIVKIIIVVGLFRAIKAARAYESERRAEGSLAYE